MGLTLTGLAVGTGCDECCRGSVHCCCTCACTWSCVWIVHIHIRDVQCFAGASGMGMGCGWDVHVQDVQRGGMTGS